MGFERLSDFLREHGVTSEVLSLSANTATVADAANALGTTPDRIIKSVLVMAESTPVLVITNGTARIDTKLLARHLGVSKNRVKLAKPATVLEITGFEVGGVPPFGHKQRIRTIIDERVLALPEVYGGSGSHDSLLKVAPAEIVRVAEAQPVDFSEPSES
ncbi:aminoacyl-tRNA deacylase [Saccharospirillum salsuginis]|uniref:YbaK/aminoacyl-tRNA synthetase-associated domain-containing protein n=1 Tax=Saccharospirillum salsuginis TaxID=418750 RepID=A0A918KT75_9GAMM|nr:YbaK/EbsC family protein [Saccharospirillum salsuginis]GGX72466.1 hypothetical protein GCM10007392_44910 [Saccharospirillum salsuginis]